MASTGVVNVSTVVGNKIAKMMSGKTTVESNSISLRELTLPPSTCSQTKDGKGTRVVTGKTAQQCAAVQKNPDNSDILATKLQTK